MKKHNKREFLFNDDHHENQSSVASYFEVLDPEEKEKGFKSYDLSLAVTDGTAMFHLSSFFQLAYGDKESLKQYRNAIARLRDNISELIEAIDDEL